MSPQYEQPLGVVVSQQDGDIDWPSVRSAGITFAYLLATEGDRQIDAAFAKNWALAKTAGLVRGAYHVFDPNRDPRRQATFFARVVKLEQDDLPPVLDLETAGDLSPSALASAFQTCAMKIEHLIGKRPVIATNDSFWNQHLAEPVPPRRRAYGLWILDYSSGEAPWRLPNGWNHWVFWQYTEQGLVPGFRWPARLSRFNGTADQLVNYTGLRPIVPSLPETLPKAAQDEIALGEEDVVETELELEPPDENLVEAELDLEQEPPEEELVKAALEQELSEEDLVEAEPEPELEQEPPEEDLVEAELEAEEEDLAGDELEEEDLAGDELEEEALEDLWEAEPEEEAEGEDLEEDELEERGGEGHSAVWSTTGGYISRRPSIDAREVFRPSTKPSQSAQHIVSTGFASQTQSDTPLASAIPLTRGQSYYFWLEIGAPVAGSIEKTPTPLPIELLPPKARLQVMIFAFDHELQFPPGADVGELEIQSSGGVTVVRQPTTGVHSTRLSKRLFFPVMTPSRAGRFRLRCSIYYQHILVQSRVIYAQVMRAPTPRKGRPALSSILDYTLARSLKPAYLMRLPPHQLSLMLNRNGDGTHGFRFVGAEEFKSDASLEGQALQDLVRQARGALRLAAWGDEEPWEKSKAYRYADSIEPDQLKTDLIRFALRGFRFYDALINRLSGGRDQALQLSALMRETGRVQIALKESANQVFPAALFYDYAFDTGAPQASYTLCPGFLSALQAAPPLEESECFRGHCPSRGQETVICPSGFWGYRHALGMPLSVAEAPDAPPEIAYTRAPEFTVGVSTDPAFKLRAAHEQALHTLLPGLGWNYANSRAKTLDLLKDTRPHVVYFYCHGGLANNVPYIQVGPPAERGITRDNLRFKDIYWKSPRPLVFINGCHTTAVEPEQALELVSGFVGTAGAAGVIGTEITIFEPMARAFAEECLRHFLAGMEIGEAIRRARLALLKAGNPLGLVYIPFVLASLRLVKQPV